jgi:segregation and condensation protein A
MTSEPMVAETKENVQVKVNGEDFNKFPKDLYIPPDALEVFLDAFEGPLDLLLYLIKRQNLDILNIPIVLISQQYIEYISMIEGMRWELAAEYLVMAATLAEIKSRMLLPRQESEEGEEEDPRADLVRRLQEYERFKKAAEDIDALPRLERDTSKTYVAFPKIEVEKPEPVVELQELLKALSKVLKRIDLSAHHKIEKETLSLQDRMARVLAILERDKFVTFESLFTISEGRPGVVVSFIAILELLKNNIIDIVQSGPFEPIHLRSAIDDGAEITAEVVQDTEELT